MSGRKISCSAGKMLFNVHLERMLDVINFLNGWKQRHYEDRAVDSYYSRN
jgi:hypothetical protein